MGPTRLTQGLVTVPQIPSSARASAASQPHRARHRAQSSAVKALGANTEPFVHSDFLEAYTLAYIRMREGAL
jgi:hypothetical protein